MSSPIANQNPNELQKQLVTFHQRSLHSNRIAKLSASIAEVLFSLFPSRNHSIRALDVGCGDMTLAEKLNEMNSVIQWSCTDIHELPSDLQNSEKWKKYCTFNGRELPFPDDTFDVVLFSDVLHHCMPQAQILLREAARIGRFIIVKDHFEHSWYSRQMLRLMDFVGNYGYGIEIPKRYFTPTSFHHCYAHMGLCEVAPWKYLDLYSHSLIGRVFLRKSWQFLAILQKEKLQ